MLNRSFHIVITREGLATRGGFIEEGDFLLQHTLEHLTLDGGVYEAHGGVVDEVAHKLEHGAAREKNNNDVF